MNFFLISLLVMASADSDIEEQIQNGQLADIEHFPFHAALLVPDNQCSGTLISYTFIVTTASCIYNVPVDKITVVLGNAYLPNGFKKSVVRTICHPEYNATVLKNDIGLVELDPLDFGDTIYKIGLPEIDEDSDFETVLVTVSGFGSTAPDEPTSQHLMYGNLSVIPNKECAKFPGPVPVTETNMCAVGRLGESLCFGDSGAPLVHRLRKILIGIGSFVPELRCDGISGYTRVTSYRKWIQDHTDA